MYTVCGFGQPLERKEKQMADQVIPDTDKTDVALIAAALRIVERSSPTSESAKDLAKKFTETYRALYDAVRAPGRYEEKIS